MDDPAQYFAQKTCHAHDTTLDKLDKFVKMSFLTKWTENISWMIVHRKYVGQIGQICKMSFSKKWTKNISCMILRITLHRKYVTLIALNLTNWTNL